MVVLGGRAKKANVELHDVRWVIGTRIGDTYSSLRKEWFGIIEGLHIDSYKKIDIEDDCEIIKKVGNWEIELILENNSAENTYYPDWYGYKRIDMI